jgi:hypothetical protein
MMKRTSTILITTLIISALLIIQVTGCLVAPATPAGNDNSSQQVVKSLPLEIDNSRIKETKPDTPDSRISKNLTPNNIANSRIANQIIPPKISDLGLPKIVYFIANYAESATDRWITLAWVVSGASKVTLDHGIGEVHAIGHKGAYGEWDVHPTESTVYNLTAINSNGTSTASVIVILNPSLNTLPVINNFIVTPSEFHHCIGRDKPITLYFSWDVTGPKIFDIKIWREKDFVSGGINFPKYGSDLPAMGSASYDYILPQNLTQEKWGYYEGANIFTLDVNSEYGTLETPATVYLYGSK